MKTTMTFTVDEAAAQIFRARVPERKRSFLIQQFMYGFSRDEELPEEKELEGRKRALEAQIESSMSELSSVIAQKQLLEATKEATYEETRAKAKLLRRLREERGGDN